MASVYSAQRSSIFPSADPPEAQKCCISKTALHIINALGAILIVAGIGCLIASLEIPGVALIVVGFAALVLGFGVSQKYKTKAITLPVPKPTLPKTDTPIPIKLTHSKPPVPSFPSDFFPAPPKRKIPAVPNPYPFAMAEIDHFTLPPSVHTPASLLSTPVVPPPKPSKTETVIDRAVTPKVYEPVPKEPIAKFEIISGTALDKLLNEVPELKTKMVAQKRFPADISIRSIYHNGIPEKLDHSSNSELRDQMRFLIYKISNEKSSAKRKELLIELSDCLIDCAPVSQGAVGKMYIKYSGLGAFLGEDAFVRQIRAMIVNLKDKAVDEAMYEMYPAMQDSGYGPAHHGRPSEQFPHAKNGFIAVNGVALGLDTTAATGDSNRNLAWGRARGSEFIANVKKRITAAEIVKALVVETNTSETYVSNEDFMKWAGENSLGDAIMYDEGKAGSNGYPGYADKASEAHQGYTKAFIDEATALQVIQKLGFIV